MVNNLGNVGYDSTLDAIPLVLVFCPRFYYTEMVMDKEVAKSISIYSVFCPHAGWVQSGFVPNS
jgi:hypothetical protein